MNGGFQGFGNPSGPGKRQIDDRARMGNRLQSFEGGGEHGEVGDFVAGGSQGLTSRKRDAGDAGCSHAGGEFRDVGKDDGADARRLDLPRDQSHGPAAKGSDRDEKSDVDLFFFEPLDDLWGRIS